MVEKEADKDGNFSLKFVKLEVFDDAQSSPSAVVQTLYLFKLNYKPDSSNEAFIYCKEMDVVIKLNEKRTFLYKKTA